MKRYWIVGLVLVAVLTGVTASSAAWARRTHLRAEFSAADARGPGLGHARYKGNSVDDDDRASKKSGQKLRVRVRLAGVADGTVVVVNACGATEVGSMALRLRGKYARGKMKLMSKKGDAVPDCAAGQGISVSGPGVALSGTFARVGND